MSLFFLRPRPYQRFRVVFRLKRQSMSVQNLFFCQGITQVANGYLPSLSLMFSCLCDAWKGFAYLSWGVGGGANSAILNILLRLNRPFKYSRLNIHLNFTANVFFDY